MELRKPYKDLRETIAYMKQQIIESIPFATETVPPYLDRDPRGLWAYLKPKIKYVNDPPRVELLQKMQTLFSNRGSGIYGGGDCDCFVITVTACCNVLCIPSKIALVGRSKRAPVHIYNYVRCPFGRWYAFDLTQPLFGSEREYPYKQEIGSNLTFN